MFATGRNTAILDLEDDAAVNIQPLAVSVSTIVMNADHAAVIICEYML